MTAFARIGTMVLGDVRLHDLRHAVAIAMANAGASAIATSRMLGHSSVSFTADVYTFVDDEMVAQAAAGLAQAFGS